MATDFYQVLGVLPGASTVEIKDAYRRLVRLHHPDANPENREFSEALMKQVLEAYATLSDSIKRTRYDNEQKLRAFEKSHNHCGQQISHHPTPGVSNAATPSSLMGKVRLALGDLSPAFAAKLGISEADLCAFESRDAMPRSALQMRTFANLVERAAQKLEETGKVSEAQELRSGYERKKANRNFLR